MKKILTQYGVCALAVALMVTLAQALAQTPAPGRSFRDCSNGCPEMVVVPQGSFTMGAPAGEEERENLPNQRRGRAVPQHLVTIRHKFAIGKFDVTRDEYAQFVAETNRPDPDSCITVNASGTDFIATNGNWHSPGFPQTGRDPVVCVSWDDAQAYVAWLSAKTGHVYRLPTEAEWEYAARAGTTTARYGSDNPAEICRYTNVADLDFSEQHHGDERGESHAATGMHSRRRLEVFRRTNSASTICLAMSWIGLKIAGTPTIAARLPMARRGNLETVVGALCVAVPGTLISASSARLTADRDPHVLSDHHLRVPRGQNTLVTSCTFSPLLFGVPRCRRPRFCLKRRRRARCVGTGGNE